MHTGQDDKSGSREIRLERPIGTVAHRPAVACTESVHRVPGSDCVNFIDRLLIGHLLSHKPAACARLFCLINYIKLQVAELCVYNTLINYVQRAMDLRWQTGGTYF